MTVLACLYGELLLNGVTQANLDDGVTNSDIRTFYTWERDSIPINRAFVTLQFPNNTITPTKVVVYCLEMMQLQATEPGRIRLYSSTTESIYPVENEIDLDNNDIVTEDVKCGRTSGNDNYKYIRYNITIPQEIRVPLNYLRIEFELGGMVDWIFISEVEVYHLFEPCKLMLEYLTYIQS